jgi:peroxiredoxin
MVSLNPPICDFGWPAPDFDLPGVDGKRYRLEELRGPKGLVVMFICNHCPYVKAIHQRLVEDMRALRALGVNAVAISSNDAVNYPEDSFENMKQIAQQWQFGFPYLFDETQQVAKAYGAVCTPDFFGFNADLQLQYRGRLDEQGREPNPKPGLRRELLEAMTLVAQTGRGPVEQIASIGCSIKWKD